MADQWIETRHAGAEPPTTRWSMIAALGGETTRRRRALEAFARDYWPAVYAFARKKGCSPEEAEDATQDFLTELMEGTGITGVTPEAGRFRSWLLAALHNHLRNRWRNQGRQKRGGGRTHVSIDRDLGEAWLEAAGLDGASPDVVFDRRWAAGILERAVEALAATYDRAGQTAVAATLVPLLAGPAQRGSYAEAARVLGITEANARVLAFRMRKRLRVLIREEVAATVGSAADVDAEIDHLFAICGAAQGPHSG